MADVDERSRQASVGDEEGRRTVRSSAERVVVGRAELLDQASRVRGAHQTQKRARAAGEQCSAHPAAPTDSAVADGVYAAEQRDEGPRGDEAIDDVAPDPPREQLRSRDDAVLPPGERRDDLPGPDFVGMLCAPDGIPTLTADIAVNVGLPARVDSNTTLCPARPPISVHAVL